MESAAHAVQKGAAAVIDKGVDTIDRLIREVCDLVPLAVLCKGIMHKNRETLFLLKNHTIIEPGEWAEKAGMTLRQMENISTTHTGMSPSFAIPFYYGLRYLLLSSFGGRGELIDKEDQAFCQNCVDHLQKNLSFYQGLIFQ
jgi:hypothetical protein